MAATDRNVLRLGAFEIRYTDTPDRVAINEIGRTGQTFRLGQFVPIRQRHPRSTDA